jgi:hypothetical protein
MLFKQWEAVVQVIGVIGVAIWLVLDLGANGPGATIPEAAAKLVWAMVGLIVANIVGTILVAILVSVVRREEFKDEKADERDRFIGTKSNRNGYIVTSSVAGLSILALAFSGIDPVYAVYALFAAPVLGGVTDAVSQLVYYRIG